VHRLNKADETVLRRFLQAVPPQHFVAEGLLLDPTFSREATLLAAIPGGEHDGVLETVLIRRGPSRTLTRALIEALGDPLLAPVSARILRRFGSDVLDHLLAAFGDPDAPDGARQALGQLLSALPGDAVDRLCQGFGPEPSALDDRLAAVIAAMGDTAVAPLAETYARPNLMERLIGGLVSRHTNRRQQIVRTLAAIGSAAARRALTELLEREKDGNLRLRLQQALHAGDERAGGGDGPHR
jgi:hypothetical protein